VSRAPRTVPEWRELYRTRGPGPTAEAWLLRLAEVDAATQRAALCGLPDMRALRQRFEAAWDDRGRPLAGVPFLAKDLFAERGARIGAGSTFLGELLAPAAQDASLLAAFRDDAGAVLCGKTQLNEFAFGLSGENPHFGDCPHPTRPGLLSGGSSSGSAWAVGAGLVPFALATDTVGSIRVPATQCGVHGLRLPVIAEIDGVFPLSPGFDTVGWMAGNAADLADVSSAVLGDCAPRPLRGLWVGDLGAGLTIEVLDAVRRTALALGASIDEAGADATREGLRGSGRAYPVLGGRAAARVHAPWMDKHADAYDPVVLARLRAGRARGEDEVLAAESVRQRVVETFAAVFEGGWDYVALPCTAGVAQPRHSHDDRLREQLLTLNAPASLAGLGALALPVPVGTEGLTAGLQLVARDTDALRAAVGCAAAGT